MITPPLLVDPAAMPVEETLLCDVLVLGGGVAGLRAAIEAAAGGARVIVVTKDSIRESNSEYAQGGVAAVLSDEDSVEAHRDDTLTAGDGLCDPASVELVVREGPELVRELIEWGGRFDRSGGQLSLTREGGHSRPRIVHAGGDATGVEVQSVLVKKTTESAGITLLQYAFAVDLIAVDGRCTGALVWRPTGGLAAILARATILATGGSGQVFRETTNPEIATGDGVAMAYRAGADVADLEFFQFHPTTLYVAGAARHLISEAVRGEGALLRDAAGDRFMVDYHPLAELAPRDVVSRSIMRHIVATGTSHVFLDLRPLGDAARGRFPGINRICALYHIDIVADLIPVHPSAHYMVGGVLTDLDGATTVPGLWCAGEVASTGLHGANRLGSNSLLEGLVFGRRAGRAAASLRGGAPAALPELPRRDFPLPGDVIHLPDMVNSVKSLLWRHVGILRRGETLREAVDRLETWSAYVLDCRFRSPRGFELVNMLILARLIAASALWREESRGTHFRTDFPERDDGRWRIHSNASRTAEVHGQTSGR